MAIKIKKQLMISTLILIIYFGACYFYVKGSSVASTCLPETTGSSEGMAVISTQTSLTVKVTRTPISYLLHEVFFIDKLGSLHAVFLGVFLGLNIMVPLWNKSTGEGGEKRV